MGSSDGDEEGGGGFTLPPDMSEEDVVKTVRDLLGDDDMTDEMIMDAVRSGIISELCPDLAVYAKTASKKNVEAEDENDEVDQNLEPQEEQVRPRMEVKEKQESKSELVKPVKVTVTVKREQRSDSDGDGDDSTTAKHSSSHKKKKKKHKKEHKKKDREREKVKEEKKERPKPVIVSDSSEEDDRPRKEDKERHKKKKKKQVIYFSDSSDSDKEKKPKPEVKIKLEGSSKKKPEDELDIKPKIHPFYQDRGVVSGGPTLPSTSASSKDVHVHPKEVKKEREKTPEKKKLPKPFSKYNGSVSVSNLRKWRPFLDRHHLKYQRRFSLKPVSVVCVDLLNLPLVFHNPHRKPKNPASVPLTSQVTLSDTRLEMIRRLERDKTTWFKGKINKKAMKFMKHYKNGTSKRYLDSSDDGRKQKRQRIMDRIVSSGSSNSDSSDVIIPHKKKKYDDDSTQRGRGKMSKSAREAELKKKKLEEIKKKSDKFSARGTRVLDWENKDRYFKDKRKGDALKEKEKALEAEKKKRIEKLRKERLAKQNNGPSVSFQRILAQIDAANKTEAARPKVALKIPKICDQNKNNNAPPTEFKVMKKLSVGDVYKEVARLLSSDVKVKCPVIPEVPDDLGEYTVKKIAWWLLKNEKEPAAAGVWHPELHDDDELESIHEDDHDWPDDMSSIHGCVSDPEGLAADIPIDRSKINDPDWADDYCGEASLSAKIRRSIEGDNWESVDNFKSFLRTKPGTNYQRPNFEVKCFVCDSIITGQRQLGAHIRSAAHKDNFRNYSLTMSGAGYEERVEPVVPKKEFVAKLIEYTVNATNSASNTEDQPAIEEVAHQVGKIERVRSESPGPIIAGDAAANVITCQEPIPDDVSFGSMENYDISSDDSLMQVKVKIRTLGEWDDDLERRWREWKDKEDIIAQKYNAQREFYIENPDKHQAYQDEWLNFWNNRCTELEAQGIETENYDFNREWLPFWLKRVQELLKEKVEEEVSQLKKSLSIDKHTLRARFKISAEETKRREKTNRKDDEDLDLENSSSLKTSSKVRSANEPPHSTKHKEKDTATANKFENQTAHRSNSHKNNESSKHKHFDHRNHHRKEKHERRSQHHHHEKEKHARPHQHHNNNRDRKRHADSGLPRWEQKQEKEKVSPSDSRSRSANDRNKIRDVPKTLLTTDHVSSKNSPAEPPPPREENFAITNASHPLPVENWEEEESDIVRAKGEYNESSRNHMSAWEVGSSPGVTQGIITRKEDGASDISDTESINSQQLAKKLKELKEALASEERCNQGVQESSKPRDKSPERNLQSAKKKFTMEDGEVASDVSSSSFTFDPTSVGAATFVNKEIPGWTDLTDKDKPKPLLSSENLDKGSLGYHLLERRNSTEAISLNERSERYKEKRHANHINSRVERNKHRNDFHEVDGQNNWNKIEVIDRRNEEFRQDRDDRNFNNTNHWNYL